MFRQFASFAVLLAIAPLAFMLDIGMRLVEWLEQEEDTEFYEGA